MRHQQTTARFRQATDSANEASLAKSRFLATASHEFRTPLTTIQAGVDLLLRYRDKMDESQGAEYLHDVTRQVKTITRLLDNLLLAGRRTRPTSNISLRSLSSPMCARIWCAKCAPAPKKTRI